MGRLVTALVMLVGTLVALLPAPGTTLAQETTPQSPLALVQAYHTAWDAHDLDAALGYFTEDAVLTGCQCPTWAAKREAFRTSFAFRQDLERFNYRASGDTITWDWCSYPDHDRRFPPIEGWNEATVQHGMITAITVAVDPASERRRIAAQQRFSAVQATQTASAVQAAAGGVPAAPDT